MTAPTRRGLLAGIATLVPVASALPLRMPPAAPDAVLLALCDRFHALHTEAEATTTDEALTAAQEQRRDVQHQLQPIVPTTAAGQAAKARIALHLLDEAFGPRFPGDFLDFGLTTLAEIAGVAPPAEAEDRHVVMVEPAVFPDAELLTACANADAVQRRQDALYTGATRVENDDERDALLKPLDEEQKPFLQKVFELRAQTLVGHMARAQTIALYDKDLFRPGGAGWNELLPIALVRDLMGEAQV